MNIFFNSENKSLYILHSHGNQSYLLLWRNPGAYGLNYPGVFRTVYLAWAGWLVPEQTPQRYVVQVPTKGLLKARYEAPLWNLRASKRHRHPSWLHTSTFSPTYWQGPETPAGWVRVHSDSHPISKAHHTCRPTLNSREPLLKPPWPSHRSVGPRSLPATFPFFIAMEEIVMGREKLVSGANSYTQLENNILISSSLKKNSLAYNFKSQSKNLENDTKDHRMVKNSERSPRGLRQEGSPVRRSRFDGLPHSALATVFCHSTEEWGVSGRDRQISN